MQNGKAGSYFWAWAGPAAETDAIAKIAKAKPRIGIFLTIGDAASTAIQQTGDVDPGQFTFARAVQRARYLTLEPPRR